jgi:hypothetical protein
MLNQVLKKINKCVNYEMLFCLEEAFNSVGLTLQPTKQNRMVLCTVQDGKPRAGRIFEDYIHIGSLESRSESIPQPLLKCISDFVIENAGSPCDIKNSGSSWQESQNSLYGLAMEINPDHNKISLGKINADPLPQSKRTPIQISEIAFNMEEVLVSPPNPTGNGPQWLQNNLVSPKQNVYHSHLQMVEEEIDKEDLPSKEELQNLTANEVKNFLRSFTEDE